jgi:hypothetical protein
MARPVQPNRRIEDARDGGRRAVPYGHKLIFDKWIVCL